MAIKQGGLGLQHPRTNAISSYMSTTKRCLQYAHQGVWLGFNKNRPILPDSIRSLYLDWETSNDRTWTIFRKYMHDFTSICCGQAHSQLDYDFNTSINKSRETIKEHAAIKMRKEGTQTAILHSMISLLSNSSTYGATSSLNPPSNTPFPTTHLCPPTFPDEDIVVAVDYLKARSSIKSSIYKHWGKVTARDLFSRHYKICPDAFDLVYWDCMGK
eukprot:scaffold94416_cov109-Cyclotella_meneghiniana.AAC.1